MGLVSRDFGMIFGDSEHKEMFVDEGSNLFLFRIAHWKCY